MFRFGGQTGHVDGFGVDHFEIGNFPARRSDLYPRRHDLDRTNPVSIRRCSDRYKVHRQITDYDLVDVEHNLRGQDTSHRGPPRHIETVEPNFERGLPNPNSAEVEL